MTMLGFLTRDFKATVKERAARDPAFARAMLDEAVTAFLNGQVEIADLISQAFARSPGVRR